MNKGGYQIIDLGGYDYGEVPSIYFDDCFDKVHNTKKPIMIENGVYNGIPIKSQFVELTYRDAGTVLIYDGDIQYTAKEYLTVAIGYEKDTHKQYIALS